MAKKDEYKEKRLDKIGKRLKKLRKSAGYTSSEKFAYEKDINRSQYGKYEAGMDMRMSTFLKLIDLLGVSPSEFFSEGFDDE